MWRRYCVQINMFWWTMLILLFSPLSGTCEKTVLYVGQNQTYTTLQEAVRSLTENQSAEIVIEGVICEKGQLEIRNCKLRLIAEKNAQWIFNGLFTIRENAAVILGGDEGILSITGNIIASNSDVQVSKGVEITSEGTALSVMHGSLVIDDGSFRGTTGIELVNTQAAFHGGMFCGAPALLAQSSEIHEITGGLFFSGEREAVHLSYSRLERITDGRFVSAAPSENSGRAAFYADHESYIHTIYGGNFTASSGSGLLLIRGSKIGTIHGGTFESLSGNEEAGYCHHGLAVIAGSDGYETGIGAICGGTFHAYGDTQSYGAFLQCNADGTVYIGSIEGNPCFTGTSGMVIENVHSTGTAKVHQIAGGRFYSKRRQADLYLDAGLKIASGYVETIAGGAFVATRWRSPAVLLTAVCEMDTQSIGESGYIESMNGGRFISVDAPAVSLGNHSRVGCISGGFYYGSCAVMVNSGTDLHIDGGIFFGTRQSCIRLEDRQALLILEHNLQRQAAGNARFMVKDYLMEGVQDKHIFAAYSSGQIVFPSYMEKGAVQCYELTGQDTETQHISDLVKGFPFFYLISAH